MKKSFSYFCILLSLAMMVSCRSVDIEQYADNKPVMDLQGFFNGDLRAHGIVKNRKGDVIRYFSATIDASWDNKGVGTLDETFKFDDGEVQKRVWILTPDVDGRYTGTANDVIGQSPLLVAGNSLFLNYVLRIPYNDGSLDLTIDDRMYLVSDSVLINESIMTKWGFKVGQISLVIEKDVEN